MSAIVDVAALAAGVTEGYANVAVTVVNDHVVRMSVMTGPFRWHRHPDADETFLVMEGVVLVSTSHEQVELRPGQLYTVEAGVDHVTQPLTTRSVNLTVEPADMTTEWVEAPTSR